MVDANILQFVIVQFVVIALSISAGMDIQNDKHGYWKRNKIIDFVVICVGVYISNKLGSI